MYHACTLRGPPAGLETSSQGTGCVHCVLDTHTRLAPRGLLRLAPCLLRCRVQRANALADSWNRFCRSRVEFYHLWAQSSRERVNRGARAPWPHHDTLLPAEPAAVLCTCTSARRWSSDRAAHLESETVPRMGSVGTFSVVTYVNCLRPTAAELLPLLHIVHAPAHASTSAPPQS